ncbi:hypothetical protein BjapCC829_24755 [Bradyrhizobium barranii]|uniref:Uncharacterized protein n=1 Tax=Bradyrhizobium barranii TaxID=2992140 RepID=A0ABY3QBM5_9BRAD|nr:hypothetical protein [Bradyrhizobium japonicum]UFW83188.1 hypothetical protein BjapCC829_24755 [Bradyrhizobium japonicum]
MTTEYEASDTDVPAPRHPKGRADLFALAEKLRRRQETLYTLGSPNDPWMAEADFRSKHAYWIADIFERFDIRSRVHVRRVHYRLVSQEPPILQVDGTPYVNSFDCFNRLCDAIRDARYLDLISTDVVIDRRNPEPVINRSDDDDTAAEIEIIGGSVERRDFGPSYAPPDVNLPEVLFSQEPSIGQPYHLEIWIEKSSMDEVLLPLSQEFRVNVARFIGEVSATACKDLVERAIASGKPVRIGYISDFDPAGLSMPIAAAVKIDWFAKKSDVDLDIRLEPLALTEAQCLQYQLPRTPIKKTENRAAGFEARYGSGATELDALEATHPGVLREILVEFIDRYYDHDLDEEVEHAVEQYRDELDGARSEIEQQFSEQLRSLNEDRERIAAAFELINDPAAADYRRAVAEAWRIYNEALERGRPEIAEMEHRLIMQAESVLARMKAALDESVPDAELFDWPEPAEGDEDDDALYASTRDYVEQVDVYRAHRGNDEEVGLAADRIVPKTCQFCGESFNGANPKKVYCSKACTNKSFKNLLRARGDAGPSQAKKQHDGGSGAAS